MALADRQLCESHMMGAASLQDPQSPSLDLVVRVMLSLMPWLMQDQSSSCHNIGVASGDVDNHAIWSDLKQNTC